MLVWDYVNDIFTVPTYELFWTVRLMTAAVKTGIRLLKVLSSPLKSDQYSFTTSLSANSNFGTLILRNKEIEHLNQPSHNRNQNLLLAMASVHKREENITKSQEDKRLYRGLELTNGLKIMLISDSTTDKSAAAMDVKVGYMSDPDNLPGLAHFLEHMLFLGTKKFPEENEYSKYLSEHGGGCNAFTAPDHTNFYFDVAPEALPGALDRFAQFFIAPLFTEGATDREMLAVHSEHEKNLKSDNWRFNQLEKSTSDPTHPYSKFGTGSKDTLGSIPKGQGINVREELLKFHHEWYSANIMGLCVLGKESLDHLETEVLSLFSDVKSKNVTPSSWMSHPHPSSYLKKTTNVVPVKDIRRLMLSFPIPDLERKYFKSSPSHYLGHLVGHEGPGSLFSLLKQKGWANALVGGHKSGARGFAFFTVTIDLAEDGMQHIDDIIYCIFQYMKLLKSSESEQWVFDECRLLGDMQFHFKDKERPQGYTCSIASMLQEYPISDVLCAGYLLTEWKPELIQTIQGCLLPDNVRVTVVSKEYEGQTNLKEKWYGTNYSIKDILPETVQSWKSVPLHPELKLPSRNEFIPTDFALVQKEEAVSAYPTLLLDTPLSRVWVKQDNEFLLPKLNMFIEMISPLAYLDPLHCNLAHMYTQLVKDSLNEYTYAAEVAGLGYDLSNTKYGLTLVLKGYSHKLPVLLERILERMTHLTIDPQRFALIKESYQRGLVNFQAEQPHQQASYYTSMLLAERVWTKQETLEATQDLTVECLQGYIPQLLSRIYMECLVHGNITHKLAVELIGKVEMFLQDGANTKPLLKSQRSRDREVQLSKGCHFVYEAENKIHISSCLENYYQCGIQTTKINMMLELLLQILHEPCHNVLRTQEQLGYIVFSGLRRSSGAQGMRVLIQSEKHPAFVDSRVEAFLESMKLKLDEMSSEEYTRHVEALAIRRLEKPKTLSELSSRFWSEIVTGQYHFNREVIEVEFLRTISKEDIIVFFEDMVSPESVHRHKLTIHVVSSAPGGATEKLNTTDGIIPVEPPCSASKTTISDVTSFKQRLSLFPLVGPYDITTLGPAKAKL